MNENSLYLEFNKNDAVLKKFIQDKKHKKETPGTSKNENFSSENESYEKKEKNERQTNER